MYKIYTIKVINSLPTASMITTRCLVSYIHTSHNSLSLLTRSAVRRQFYFGCWFLILKWINLFLLTLAVKEPMRIISMMYQLTALALRSGPSKRIVPETLGSNEKTIIDETQNYLLDGKYYKIVSVNELKMVVSCQQCSKTIIAHSNSMGNLLSHYKVSYNN